jgi:hypothetical protein
MTFRFFIMGRYCAVLNKTKEGGLMAGQSLLCVVCSMGLDMGEKVYRHNNIILVDCNLDDLDLTAFSYGSGMYILVLASRTYQIESWGGGSLFPIYPAIYNTIQLTATISYLCLW